MLNTISFFNVLYFVYFSHLLLLQPVDIEKNYSPKSGQSKNFSCCHWNINSLVAQNLSKTFLVEAYNSLYKHDFIYMSKTCFNSSILKRNASFKLDGYKIIRADHPSNTKRGGVFTYYKKSLSVIYRSSSQSTIEFDEFLSNFEDILNTTASFNSLLTTILGGFNARSSFRWKKEKLQ